LGAYAAVPAPGQIAPPGVAVPTPGTPAIPVPARPGTQTPQAQQQQEQLRIVPDPATNSLIIYGTVQEFQNIRNILKELDAIPRQVLIEAMVLQVDLNDTESLGVDVEILRKTQTTIFGQKFNSRGALRTLGDLFPSPPSFGGGSGLSGIVRFGEVQALINALMTDSRVKLISSPSVLAADNRPARIQVGSEEPIPTGTINAAVGAVTPSSSTTIQYRNTGRILTIIPQVNSKGLVNLQIKAEVSARGDDVPFGSGETFPSFNTQDAETTAVVHDGETLVIGGLIGERKSKTRSGIPYLMDIPVVGRFFGTTSDETRRTELIMLITPHVIRNLNESRYVTEEFKAKVNSVRNELERIERERAKSQPKLPPPEIPPPVEPKTSEEQPPIAPGRFVPRSGASVTPGQTQVTVLSNVGAVPTTPQPRNVAGESSAPRPGDHARADAAATGETIPVVLSPGTSAAYLLSLGQYQAAAPVPVTRASSERQNERKYSREWAVQVAALADRKDADAMVAGMRKNGYEAYVMTVQTESKTWHRVRVGQFPDVAAAKRLRQSLVDALQLKGAYVAAN
jgi:cell division septation protein DedD